MLPPRKAPPVFKTAKTFFFPDIGRTVAWEVDDNSRSFFHRLRIWGGESTDVIGETSVYQHLCSVTYGETTFICATAYYEGTLPCEEVLLVSHGVQKP